MADAEQSARTTEAPEQGPQDGALGPGPVEGGRATAAPTQQKPPRTRVSVTFQALIAGFVVLVLLLIFILENTESVKINYLGAKGHISLGIALLLAAAGGALIVAIVGVARISQLRLHERRQRRRL
ncbi:MAG: lipopolysaccharide assembly protein LapA domain-containing protein [Solirubrobacteraceae bacterium]